ncbi:hypothetical protein RJ639_021707 [Escallonia herrerae]|uniref:Uncharacterized protein n=1 Tax=Escallonia herrerae TaxID=1293975 RepID=A0AA88V5N0_9ASTE|nr:hypothetical protein RJ639_021707 [Escallonia herrerae]
MEEPGTIPVTVNDLSKEMRNNSTSFTRLEEVIFGVTFVTIFALLQLPCERTQGSRVPTVIFKGKPAIFHAFVVSLDFAFTGAVMTMSLRQGYPHLARHCRLLAIFSVAAVAGILVCLAVDPQLQALKSRKYSVQR